MSEFFFEPLVMASINAPIKTQCLTKNEKDSWGTLDGFSVRLYSTLKVQRSCTINGTMAPPLAYKYADTRSLQIGPKRKRALHILIFISSLYLFLSL